MTKKKIRYSEFPSPTGPTTAAMPAARTSPDPAPAPLPAPVAAPATAVAPAPAPAAPVIVGRLTPVHGTVTIARPTPLRGTPSIGRPTPVRGAITIVRDAPPAPAAPAMPAAPAAPAKAVPAASNALRDRARLRSGTVNLLIFSVGAEWFGVELAAVEEAIDLPAIRHVPEMPPSMLGVTTVRGSLTSVYSPSLALGVALSAPSSALVFRRARSRLGIAVDDVDDVHPLDLAHLRDVPAADSGDGILLGVLRHRDTLLGLVDAEALIAACQTVPVLETA